jgi:hypothetical protein
VNVITIKMLAVPGVDGDNLMALGVVSSGNGLEHNVYRIEFSKV